MLMGKSIWLYPDSFSCTNHIDIWILFFGDKCHARQHGTYCFQPGIMAAEDNNAFFGGVRQRRLTLIRHVLIFGVVGLSVNQFPQGNKLLPFSGSFSQDAVCLLLQYIYG